MLAWNTPLITTPTTCCIIDGGPRPAPRTALDLPGVDPVEELRARGLHRHLRRDDLDGADGGEVVGVPVGRDPLVEGAHLDVVLSPAPPARERLDLDALERPGDGRLLGPLPALRRGLLDGGLVGLGAEIGVVALVRRVLAVPGFVLADELLEERTALRVVEVHRVVAEQEPFRRELLFERVVDAARRREDALHRLEEADRRGLLHDDRRVPRPERAHEEVRLRLLDRGDVRSEEHTSELQSRLHLVCRLLLEKKTPPPQPPPPPPPPPPPAPSRPSTPPPPLSHPPPSLHTATIPSLSLPRVSRCLWKPTIVVL